MFLTIPCLGKNEGTTLLFLDWLCRRLDAGAPSKAGRRQDLISGLLPAAINLGASGNQTNSGLLSTGAKFCGDPSSSSAEITPV